MWNKKKLIEEAIRLVITGGGEKREGQLEESGQKIQASSCEQRRSRNAMQTS